MVVYKTKWKSTAKNHAIDMRRKGYSASTYKRKGGWAVCVKRK
jgi:hypothetical protein